MHTHLPINAYTLTYMNKETSWISQVYSQTAAVKNSKRTTPIYVWVYAWFRCYNFRYESSNA